MQTQRRECPICNSVTLQSKLCGECERWFCNKCRTTNGNGIIEEIIGDGYVFEEEEKRDLGDNRKE
jgi:hypothetical protein